MIDARIETVPEIAYGKPSNTGGASFPRPESRMEGRWPAANNPFTSSGARVSSKQVTSYLGTFFRTGTGICNDQRGQIIIVRIQVRDRDFQYLGQPCGR